MAFANSFLDPYNNQAMDYLASRADFDRRIQHEQMRGLQNSLGMQAAIYQAPAQPIPNPEPNPVLLLLE